MEHSVWEQFKTRELCIWVISGDDLGMRELYKDNLIILLRHSIGFSLIICLIIKCFPLQMFSVSKVNAFFIISI